MTKFYFNQLESMSYNELRDADATLVRLTPPECLDALHTACVRFLETRGGDDCGRYCAVKRILERVLNRNAAEA